MAGALRMAAAAAAGGNNGKRGRVTGLSSAANGKVRVQTRAVKYQKPYF